MPKPGNCKFPRAGLGGSDSRPLLCPGVCLQQDKQILLLRIRAYLALGYRKKALMQVILTNCTWI